MKLIARIKAAVGVVLNRYESGQRGGTARSYVPAYVQDARFDADQATRFEIVRKSRYFERNNAILQRLADLFEQYTVGAHGLQFVPASSSEDWNREASAWWSRWSEVCDLQSRQTFGTLQSLVARTWFIDGEVFILKTSGRSREGGPSYPRIQLIEGHRVETPHKLSGDANVIDGIRVDPRGRPISYYVRDGFSGDTYREVPASQMIHVFEPARVGMYRGLPFVYAVLNDLHDLDDLQMLGMQAAKQQAKDVDVLKTGSGEVKSSEDLRREILAGGITTNSQGTETTVSRTRHIDQVTGASTIALKPNEDLIRLGVTRPSAAEQQMWDYLTSKVCAGVGISKLLVFPWSMQGTVTRADLDVANAFFRSRSAVLGAAFREVWLYVMDWATQNEIKTATPEDWRTVSTRAPRSVNVDVGRNSSALISEYEAGWRTLDAICAELGDDWRQVLRQRATERKSAREIEAEFGLQEGELIKAALDAIKANKAAAPGFPGATQTKEPVAA